LAQRQTRFLSQGTEPAHGDGDLDPYLKSTR
jgi:hypothetical protein